jgi:hypothetical protein
LDYISCLFTISAIPSGIIIPSPNNLDIRLATSYKGSKTLILNTFPSSLISTIPNSYTYLSQVITTANNTYKAIKKKHKASTIIFSSNSAMSFTTP